VVVVRRRGEQARAVRRHHDDEEAEHDDRRERRRGQGLAANARAGRALGAEPAEQGLAAQRESGCFGGHRGCWEQRLNSSGGAVPARLERPLNAEGPPKRAPSSVPCRSRSDGRDVYGLRALVALLRVVGDLGALLQRAVPLAVDPRVMDEEVLVAVVRGDEAKPLVVAEPLNGAGRHGVNSSTVLCSCYAEDAAQSFDLRAFALLSPGSVPGHTARP